MVWDESGSKNVLKAETLHIVLVTKFFTWRHEKYDQASFHSIAFSGDKRKRLGIVLFSEDGDAVTVCREHESSRPLSNLVGLVMDTNSYLGEKVIITS
jgi:hypothetical protein